LFDYKACKKYKYDIKNSKMQYGSKNAKFDADFVSLLKAGKK
jgi:hypothetical protein